MILFYFSIIKDRINEMFNFIKISEENLRR